MIKIKKQKNNKMIKFNNFQKNLKIFKIYKNKK